MPHHVRVPAPMLCSQRALGPCCPSSSAAPVAPSRLTRALCCTSRLRHSRGDEEGGAAPGLARLLCAPLDPSERVPNPDAVLAFQLHPSAPRSRGMRIQRVRPTPPRRPAMCHVSPRCDSSTGPPRPPPQHAKTAQMKRLVGKQRREARPPRMPVLRSKKPPTLPTGTDEESRYNGG